MRPVETEAAARFDGSEAAARFDGSGDTDRFDDCLEIAHAARHTLNA